MIKIIVKGLARHLVHDEVDADIQSIKERYIQAIQTAQEEADCKLRAFVESANADMAKMREERDEAVRKLQAQTQSADEFGSALQAIKYANQSPNLSTAETIEAVRYTLKETDRLKSIIWAENKRKALNRKADR